MLGMSYVASTLGGTVTGMIVGDAMGAVPQTAAVPATSSSAAPKVTAEGTPVSSNVTARQTVFMSAGYVIAAMAILLLGSRFLRDARIG